MGMITIGYLGDLIGRKWGSVNTVSIMFVRRTSRCASFDLSRTRPYALI